MAILAQEILSQVFLCLWSARTCVLTEIVVAMAATSPAELLKIAGCIGFALRRAKKMRGLPANRQTVICDGLLAALQLLEEAIPRPIVPPLVQQGGLPLLAALASCGKAGLVAVDEKGSEARKVEEPTQQASSSANPGDLSKFVFNAEAPVFHPMGESEQGAAQELPGGASRIDSGSKEPSIVGTEQLEEAELQKAKANVKMELQKQVEKGKAILMKIKELQQQTIRIDELDKGVEVDLDMVEQRKAKWKVAFEFQKLLEESKANDKKVEELQKLVEGANGK